MPDTGTLRDTETVYGEFRGHRARYAELTTAIVAAETDPDPEEVNHLEDQRDEIAAELAEAARTLDDLARAGTLPAAWRHPATHEDTRTPSPQAVSRGEPVMSEVWEPVKPVSAAQANEVREVLITHFWGWTHDQDGNRLPDTELPILHAPNTGWGEHWVITWEGTNHGTPYQWETLATIGGTEEYSSTPITPAPFPAGVHCEGVNICIMGIYPA